jgi:hypothetical protein
MHPPTGSRGRRYPRSSSASRARRCPHTPVISFNAHHRSDCSLPSRSSRPPRPTMFTAACLCRYGRRHRPAHCSLSALIIAPIIARPLPSDRSPPPRSSLTCPPTAHSPTATRRRTGRLPPCPPVIVSRVFFHRGAFHAGRRVYLNLIDRYMRPSLRPGGAGEPRSARTCQMKETCYIGEFDQIEGGHAHVPETSSVGGAGQDGR